MHCRSGVRFLRCLSFTAPLAEGGVADRGGVADLGLGPCRAISSEIRCLMSSADCLRELVRGGKAESTGSVGCCRAGDGPSAVTLMTTC
jgi:hypothetical protein